MNETCERQQKLMAEVQDHLIRLAELARKEAALIGSRDEEAWLAIDKQIELEMGAKERSMGALKEHRAEHGC